MRKSFMLIITGLFIFLQCAPVPVTGRKQLNLIPESQILSLSYESYDNFLDSSKVVKGTADAEMVTRVGRNIQMAVEQYFRERRNLSHLRGFQWEYNLIQDTLVNAFAMPGGKVAVFTGILPLTMNEEGLAAVMGHEIAHAVANHGNERMSQLLLMQLGGIALSEALSSQPQLTKQLALTAFGVGAQIGVLLPYSRVHEKEADQLGITFMAMAGYNPEAAIEFWQRMQKREGPEVPEFLSTHPSDQARIESLKEYLPEAMKHYKPRAE
ncbi:MAG: M48 family metallopeptidase [Fibrobacter sp.]|nr:M48 family metallopeptidase [Fibrobacter sp.]